VVAVVLWAPAESAFALEDIILAVPGPGSLVYLPVQLAQAIGANRAEDMELKLRYFPGGPLVMRDLRDRNSDFTVVVLPAIASARADGMPVLAVGQLSQSAMVSLMLRRDLKDKIRTIAQLKGMPIGTNNSTRTARSTSQMLTEYLLAVLGSKPPKCNSSLRARITRHSAHHLPECEEIKSVHTQVHQVGPAMLHLLESGNFEQARRLSETLLDLKQEIMLRLYSLQEIVRLTLVHTDTRDKKLCNSDRVDECHAGPFI
jgi:hypothetical protein